MARTRLLTLGIAAESSYVAFWESLAATPTRRLVTQQEVADASDFLLRNAGMSAHDLHVDGGFLIR